MSIRYKPKRIYAWSPQLAYCVGLLTADGSLSSDHRHIDFTSKDIELVTTYRDLMKPTAKIGTKINGLGQQAFRVQLSDVALYDFLLAVGLTPNKSKTIGPLIIPDQYYADFLRGNFDGDGSFYSFWDKRWKSSLMYYSSFACASRPFLEWLQLQNAKHAGISGVINRSTRVYSLNYAKTSSRKLFIFMYHSEDLPCLQRKYDKIKAVFAIDPTYSAL